MIAVYSIVKLVNLIAKSYNAVLILGAGRRRISTVTKTELVRVTPFNLIGEDERGTTADFSLPRKQDQFIFIIRKKGTVSGNTYHEGKSEATNPKIFLLLSGKIIFSYRKVSEKQVTTETIQAPAMIEIAPYVTHQVEVIEEALLLECNAISDIQNDRIRENVEIL